MADTTQEKWLQWVALTTTILAVCAAIGSLRASSYSTRVSIMTTKENNAWAYFQSKSIKQHSCEVQKDTFELYSLSKLAKPERDYVTKKINSYKKEIARYDKEKADIKTEAEGLAKSQESMKHQGANFGMGVMWLQIAIMLSSVSALLRKKPLWFVGMAFGVIGLVYFLDGFFLWF